MNTSQTEFKYLKDVLTKSLPNYIKNCLMMLSRNLKIRELCKSKTKGRRTDDLEIRGWFSSVFNLINSFLEFDHSNKYLSMSKVLYDHTTSKYLQDVDQSKVNKFLNKKKGIIFSLIKLRLFSLSLFYYNGTLSRKFGPKELEKKICSSIKSLVSKYILYNDLNIFVKNENSENKYNKEEFDKYKICEEISQKENPQNYNKNNDQKVKKSYDANEYVNVIGKSDILYTNSRKFVPASSNRPGFANKNSLKIKKKTFEEIIEDDGSEFEELFEKSRLQAYHNQNSEKKDSNDKLDEKENQEDKKFEYENLEEDILIPFCKELFKRYTSSEFLAFLKDLSQDCHLEKFENFIKIVSENPRLFLHKNFDKNSSFSTYFGSQPSQEDKFPNMYSKEIKKLAPDVPMTFGKEEENFSKNVKIENEVEEKIEKSEKKNYEENNFDNLFNKNYGGMQIEGPQQKYEDHDNDNEDDKFAFQIENLNFPKKKYTPFTFGQDSQFDLRVEPLNSSSTPKQPKKDHSDNKNIKNNNNGVKTREQFLMGYLGPYFELKKEQIKNNKELNSKKKLKIKRKKRNIQKNADHPYHRYGSYGRSNSKRRTAPLKKSTKKNDEIELQRKFHPRRSLSLQPRKSLRPLVKKPGKKNDKKNKNKKSSPSFNDISEFIVNFQKGNVSDLDISGINNLGSESNSNICFKKDKSLLDNGKSSDFSKKRKRKDDELDIEDKNVDVKYKVDLDFNKFINADEDSDCEEKEFDASGGCENHNSYGGDEEANDSFERDFLAKFISKNEKDDKNKENVSKDDKGITLVDLTLDNWKKGMIDLQTPKKY